MIYKQKWYGFTPSLEFNQRCKCMNRAHTNIDGFGDEYILFSDNDFAGTPREAAALKDKWAMEQLLIGDVVIFDCDLVPLERFPFDRPGAYTAYEYGRPSPAMMASVGDEGREWWTKRNANRIVRGIDWPYGVFNKLFRLEWLREDGAPVEIPAQYYEHKRLMTEVK